MTALDTALEHELPGLLNQQSAGERDRDHPADDPPADAWSDESLVESFVQRGNHQHFEMLMARHKDRVFHIALSVLGPAQQSQAEDVAQEVFIRLYQRLHTFRGECRFSTWIYRLAFNAAIDNRRYARRHPAESLDESRLPESLTSDASSVSDPGQSRQIQAGLNGLPTAQRMMVYLFYWLDLKIPEIAEVLECPEGTVKVYLARARKTLAASLKELNHE